MCRPISNVFATLHPPSGTQAAESITGVFNKNCMIDYSNFKNIFPMWALARYTNKYPDEPVSLKGGAAGEQVSVHGQ